MLFSLGIISPVLVFACSLPAILLRNFVLLSYLISSNQKQQPRNEMRG